MLYMLIYIYVILYNIIIYICIYLLNNLNNKLDISLFFIMILHMYNLELFIKMDDITRGNGMTLFMEIFLNI